MRVLITALVPTHLMAMVPVAWALRASGHEVMVSGGPAVLEAASAAGLSGVPVKVPPGRPAPRTSAAPARAGVLGTEPDWNALRERWTQRVDGMVDDHLDFALHWRPHLVLVDPIEFCGLVVAAVLRIPAVVHRWGPDRLSSQSIPRAVEALGEVALRRGATGGPAMPSLVLDPCPPSLQCPEAAPARPVRFVPFNGAGSLPPRTVETRATQRLCVSFGGETPALTRPEPWGRLLAELDSFDGLESVITAIPPDAGALPTSVSAPGRLPLDLFLRDCSALLHHGGAGTAMTGLSFGVPQVILAQPNPSWAAVGERVEALGAGLVIDPEVLFEKGSRTGLRNALNEVLRRPGYRSAAEALAEENRRLPAPGEIVPLLKELAAERSAL